jgi:hypothetical protein
MEILEGISSLFLQYNFPGDSPYDVPTRVILESQRPQGSSSIGPEGVVCLAVTFFAAVIIIALLVGADRAKRAESIRQSTGFIANVGQHHNMDDQEANFRRTANIDHAARAVKSQLLTESQVNASQQAEIDQLKLRVAQLEALVSTQEQPREE